MIAFLNLIDDNEEKNRFKQLCNRYRGLMARVAGEKLSSQEDIEDVLQETFLYIAKNFNKIGEIGSEKTKCYVCVVTEGFAIKKYHAEQKHLYHSYDYVNIDNIVDDDLRFESYSDLIMTLNKLKDEQRNILFLTYAFGYTSKEVANIYGISADNVRKRIQFAKAEARKLLKGDD